MESMLDSLGNRMVVLMKLINVDGIHTVNEYVHELNGMIMAVEAMEIDIDFEYISSVDIYTAVILMGRRYVV